MDLYLETRMSDPARSKYDDVIEEVRVRTDAQVVCVIVFDGNKGTGMGMKMRTGPALGPLTAKRISHALRTMADHIGSHGLFTVPVRVDKG